MQKAVPLSAVAHPRRQRLSDTITSQIEQLIVHGTLKPGDALPSERDLSKQLGVSRPSLREALLILESHGLLQARRGGGFGVTDVTASTLTDPLVHLLQRYPSAVDDVLELRHGLECTAAYFAAQRATDADVKRLRDLMTAMKRRRSKREPLEDADLDVDFHMTIADASHNLALVHVMRGIFNLMRINMLRAREALHHHHDNVILLDDQHEAIVKAIVARDPAAARDAANLHLSFVQTSLREDAAPPVRKRAAAVSKAKRR
ncbi:FCD domain-containing protein [Bradyrhizobium sp. BR13661]|jgi:GntR family transcriptional repressor for pyruvate dehydrogenase complex|uniref:FadR/GntR family transcriptional regulator n=1 Tax=Bradyrhizobium sp. BR13661 TaxID=2940622 RepID=UPI00247472A7|nr:FCD domain-containing protein [Bradyrhizobium sp. BR13661]MDH6257538.1 GntR family transcriptional repressor for pyruvate dehydrogenase complex [Bradyrhizobium sp. BR13661]